MRVETIGLATLYLGDCREIAPTLARPAAVISDPPYGQNIIKGHAAVRTGNWNVWPAMQGDDKPFDPRPWLATAPAVVLWGGHWFYTLLPAQSGTKAAGSWLIWDKRDGRGHNCQGDAELAWCSTPQPTRLLRLFASGASIAGRTEEDVRGAHPTQKPPRLMRWCIEQAKVPPGGVILDPYMGSGSTGVAAAQMRHPFVGIEIEERYFDVACRRIEAAQRQSDLFRDAAAAE